jgi:hypothetical protein
MYHTWTILHVRCERTIVNEPLFTTHMNIRWPNSTDLLMADLFRRDTFSGGGILLESENAIEQPSKTAENKCILTDEILTWIATRVLNCDYVRQEEAGFRDDTVIMINFEPARLPDSVLAPPKRFFRRFWRSLVRRMLRRLNLTQQYDSMKS